MYLAVNLGNQNQHPNALSPNSCGFHYSSSILELNVSIYRRNSSIISKVLKRPLSPQTS